MTRGYNAAMVCGRRAGFWRRLSVLVAVLVFCVSGVALARPGGGQSYRSSGGGSRSSSFHSSSSHPTSFSTSSGSHAGGGTNPVVGFTILILFGCVMLVVLVANARKGRQTNSVRAAILDAQYDVEAKSRRSVTLEPLKARDPNLTEQSILDRVRVMSDMLREAWCAGDMRPARAFVSDGIYSRYRVQLELMKQEGTRNVMSEAQTLYTTLEAVQSFPPLDVVHVRFTAQARDAMVPLAATPQQIQSELARTPVAPYTEIWTLVRKQGAQTKLDPMQVGKACPSCGAPFPAGGGEVLKCTYCQAVVCSGEHDWVLSEITQIAEWHPTSAEPVAGLDALREVDLGATREVLEDRASYLFWKWVESGRTRSAAPLRKCATPELITRGGDGASELAGARDVAVGGADVLLCDVAQGEPQDYVYVKVFWSGRFQPGAEPFPRQSVLRLARKAGASTKLSMTAVVCPSCGAPLADTDDTRCGHCNTEIVASGLVWALDAIGAPGMVRPRHTAPEQPLPTFFMPDIRDPRERGVLFSQMAYLLAKNGLGRNEKRLLTACGRRWGIPEETVGRALAGQLGSGAQMGPVSAPQWFLAGLVGAALIDGTIDAAEMETLQRACTALDLPLQELDRQIQETRARMPGA